MQKKTPVVPVYLYIQRQWPGCWTVRHCDGLWSWHPLKESSPAYRPETGLSLWLQSRQGHNLISLQVFTQNIPLLRKNLLTQGDRKWSPPVPVLIKIHNGHYVWQCYSGHLFDIVNKKYRTVGCLTVGLLFALLTHLFTLCFLKIHRQLI